MVWFFGYYPQSLYLMKTSCFAAPVMATAQIQKDNLMVGGSIANIQATFQSGGFKHQPESRVFFRENLAFGLGLNLGDYRQQRRYNHQPWAVAICPLFFLSRRYEKGLR